MVADNHLLYSKSLLDSRRRLQRAWRKGKRTATPISEASSFDCTRSISPWVDSHLHSKNTRWLSWIELDPEKALIRINETRTSNWEQREQGSLSAIVYLKSENEQRNWAKMEWEWEEKRGKTVSDLVVAVVVVWRRVTVTGSVTPRLVKRKRHVGTVTVCSSKPDASKTAPHSSAC